MIPHYVSFLFVSVQAPDSRRDAAEATVGIAMLAPIIAALIHVGSELTFILNSARLFRERFDRSVL